MVLLKKIRATHIKTGAVVIMEYYSIAQAKKHNPYFKGFEYVI